MPPVFLTDSEGGPDALCRVFCHPACLDCKMYLTALPDIMLSGMMIRNDRIFTVVPGTEYGTDRGVIIRGRSDDKRSTDRKT